MAGTHSTAHNAANNSSPAKNDDMAAGTKRKPDAEPSPKRNSKATKKQATLEETIGFKEEDTEMKDASPSANDKQAQEDAKDVVEDAARDDTAATKGHDNSAPAPAQDARSKSTDIDGTGHESNGTVEGNTKDGNATNQGTSDDNHTAVNGNGAIEKSSQREKEIPSNIVEKGVIYFFTRNRVGIEDADSVGDLQRTFFVLRPMPVGAKLGDGALPDQKNNRLLALPKKAFPKSHSDRFMAFVEKANVTIADLKESFFAANEYETKTQGTRRIDPVTPIAEGVYAITRTEDRTTHLVYSTTIPSDIGEVQEDLGIKSQGSFIISVKNPERSGPASASLPQKPDFSKEIIDEFRGLAWSEVKPKYLDHAYCQILLIGEDMSKGTEATTKDKKHDKETPQEEIEKLEHEDELRVEHLHGDDTVYDDLKISKEEYPSVPTTW
ncbi:hypothetical protein ACN47E_003741 [Coniothyrium glycines]